MPTLRSSLTRPIRTQPTAFRRRIRFTVPATQRPAQSPVTIKPHWEISLLALARRPARSMRTTMARKRPLLPKNSGDYSRHRSRNACPNWNSACRAQHHHERYVEFEYDVEPVDTLSNRTARRPVFVQPGRNVGGCRLWSSGGGARFRSIKRIGLIGRPVCVVRTDNGNF